MLDRLLWLVAIVGLIAAVLLIVGAIAYSYSDAAKHPKYTPPDKGAEDMQRVVVTDIRMPFGSMVVFMVKWAIAAIPALVILWFLGMLLMALLPAVFGINRPHL